MCLVTPGATTLSSMMRWDEMPLRRLSWLTPNCRAVRFLFNIVCVLQESNGREKSACDLFVLTAFTCTKAAFVWLALLVTVNWSTHLISVDPSSFKAGSSLSSIQTKSFAWLNHRKTQRDKTNSASDPSFRGLQLCYTLKLAKWPWWGKHQLSIIDYPDFYTFT